MMIQKRSLSFILFLLISSISFAHINGGGFHGGEYHNNDGYHQNNVYNNGYHQGYDSHDNTWYGSGLNDDASTNVVIGVPAGGYYDPSCQTVQTCNPNSECITQQNCN